MPYVVPRERLTPSSGPAPFTELAPGVQSVALAPSFMLGGWRGSIARAYFGDIAALAVGYYEVPMGGVTSHGLVLHDGRLVLCDQLQLSEGSIAEAGLYGAVLEGRKPTRVIGGTAVSLAGPGHLIYGHWLVDFLPKLFVLNRLGMAPLSLRYLLPANTPRFALEWLHLLGFQDDQLILYSPYEEIMAAERLIVPTLVRTSSRTHPLFGEAARYLLDLVRNRGKLPDVGGTSGRLLISRAAAGRDGRFMVNRTEVEQLVVDAGFTPVRPEALPLAEQLALFAGARQIVGEYGSGLHGSMFSPPGTFVCAFRAAALHPGFLQSGLCEALDQKIGYMMGDAEDHAVQQEFAIEPEDVRLALRMLSMDMSPSNDSGRPSGVI